MKWFAIAVAAAGLLTALSLFIFSGFADVPCQDGVWDSKKQTCVPT
jgi:hypothetical protein